MHGESGEELLVFPENWPVWKAWLALENRWLVVSGIDGERLQGLDAAQIESVLRLQGIKSGERERIFDGLRVMEKAALAALYGNGES